MDDKRQSATATEAEPLTLTAADAAKVLGISRAHFYRLHASDQLPRPIRLGRSVRWRRDELQAWLAAGCPSWDRWKVLRGVRWRTS